MKAFSIKEFSTFFLSSSFFLCFSLPVIRYSHSRRQAEKAIETLKNCFRFSLLVPIERNKIAIKNFYNKHQKRHGKEKNIKLNWIYVLSFCTFKESHQLAMDQTFRSSCVALTRTIKTMETSISLVRVTIMGIESFHITIWIKRNRHFRPKVSKKIACMVL